METIICNDKTQLKLEATSSLFFCLFLSSRICISDTEVVCTLPDTIKTNGTTVFFKTCSKEKQYNLSHSDDQNWTDKDLFDIFGNKCIFFTAIWSINVLLQCREERNSWQLGYQSTSRLGLSKSIVLNVTEPISTSGHRNGENQPWLTRTRFFIINGKTHFPSVARPRGDRDGNDQYTRSSL